VHAPLSFSEVDGDQDGLMDFGEFSTFIRAREPLGEYTEEALRVRFDALDTSGDGYVDLREFMNHELRMALSRSSERVIDLFKQWDEDGNGKIDKKEFFRALRALGFEVSAVNCSDCH
jgi:Ca2+-binding EF-hand superfamily protein